tara:strand:- start:104 stop:1189 length:1086 start_codon:yes stop_codon:yes gene_type:complete
MAAVASPVDDNGHACFGDLHRLRPAALPSAADVPLQAARANGSLLDAGVCVRDRRSGEYGCLPSLVLIGAMKGGTTEFAEYAEQHPSLRAVHHEAHFFNCRPDYYRCANSTGCERAKAHGGGEVRCSPAAGEWWRYIERHFRGTRKVGFEKTPNYLWTRQSSANIRALLPSATLLVLLREPGARSYSHFHHSCKKRPETRGCSREEFDRLLWPRAAATNASAGGIGIRSGAPDGWQNPWSELPPESILMRSLYLMQLRHFWAAGWDCSSMWVGLSEQFFADPNRTVNELLVALRLPPHAFPVQRDARGRWSLKQVASWERSYPPMLERSRQRLDGLFRHEVHALAEALPQVPIRRRWARHF